MAELTNDFTWSKSRHDRFQECRRAYWYAYYGSWGGWEAPPGSPERELYVLKKLSSRWQWAGSLVHEALRGLLSRARRTGEVRPLDDLLAMIRGRARSRWAASREKSYWREPSPSGGLVEHEYAEPVPAPEWKRIWDEVVEGSLRAFYGSEALHRIRSVPGDRWLAVDELDHWFFEGTKVWVAVDFAYLDADGLLNLLDWKTGREREVDRVQMAVYALYAREKWKVPPERVRAGLVYLGAEGASRVEVPADGSALEACRVEMRGSIGAMKELLDDPDRNRGSVQRFPQREGREVCARCPFRRPCGRM